MQFCFYYRYLFSSTNKVFLGSNWLHNPRLGGNETESKQNFMWQFCWSTSWPFFFTYEFLILWFFYEDSFFLNRWWSKGRTLYACQQKWKDNSRSVFAREGRVTFLHLYSFFFTFCLDLDIAWSCTYIPFWIWSFS